MFDHFSILYVKRLNKLRWLSFRLESESLISFRCLIKYSEENYVNTGVPEDWKFKDTSTNRTKLTSFFQ